MIYTFALLFLYVESLSGQCSNRKFIKRYIDITSSSLIGEVFSRSQLQCSVICGKNINCVGFTRLSNGNCVMFDNVNSTTPGLTHVWIEGK